MQFGKLTNPNGRFVRYVVLTAARLRRLMVLSLSLWGGVECRTLRQAQELLITIHAGEEGSR